MGDDEYTYKKWSNYFNYKLGLLDENAALKYENSKEEVLFKKDRIRCEKWTQQLLRNSPIVVFLVKELKKVNCKIDISNIACKPCDGSRSSGFLPNSSQPILLCQNRFYNKKHLEDTLTHELIHAYDHCRYKVDWNNLYHYACSSIRASSLSGDCRFTNELKRGNFNISKQHQVCVRRRAILAVASHPNCPDRDTAVKAVNAVFDNCFNDTSPFDEIY